VWFSGTDKGEGEGVGVGEVTGDGEGEGEGNTEGSEAKGAGGSGEGRSSGDSWIRNVGSGGDRGGGDSGFTSFGGGVDTGEAVGGGVGEGRGVFSEEADTDSGGDGMRLDGSNTRFKPQPTATALRSKPPAIKPPKRREGCSSSTCRGFLRMGTVGGTATAGLRVEETGSPELERDSVAVAIVVGWAFKASSISLASAKRFARMEANRLINHRS
jgi:hypothetical protein